MRVLEIGNRRLDLDTGQDIVDLPPKVIAKARARMAAMIEDGLRTALGPTIPATKPCQCKPIGPLAHHAPGCHNTIC